MVLKKSAVGGAATVLEEQEVYVLVCSMCETVQRTFSVKEMMMDNMPN